MQLSLIHLESSLPVVPPPVKTVSCQAYALSREVLSETQLVFVKESAAFQGLTCTIFFFTTLGPLYQNLRPSSQRFVRSYISLPSTKLETQISGNLKKQHSHTLKVRILFLIFCTTEHSHSLLLFSKEFSWLFRAHYLTSSVPAVSSFSLITFVSLSLVVPQSFLKSGSLLGQLIPRHFLNHCFLPQDLISNAARFF